MTMHIFLTGERNIGKTTLINRIIDELPGDQKIGGFRTFKSGEFAPGKSYILMAPADGDMEAFRVALMDKTGPSYEAYPEAFDTGGVEILERCGGSDLILMDELGFMETDSYKFQEKIMDILDGYIPVLGAIKPKENRFLDRVRNHPKVRVIEVTESNRNQLHNEITKLLRG